MRRHISGQTLELSCTGGGGACGGDAVLPVELDPAGVVAGDRPWLDRAEGVRG